ncbi:MAG: prolyl oligopeptidase family serine peptidase [Spirochaetaceae bacterium]|jgi:hypothetical protein|nr:prolyl oligopeptidase family serine peptidase [Spirochaetaceae bacterium]
MKKLFFGLAILAIAMAFTACPAAETITYITEGGEFDGVADTSPVIKYWVVHEYYSDSMRTTKIIVDAGYGNTFKASELAWKPGSEYDPKAIYTQADVDEDGAALKELFYDKNDPYNSQTQATWDSWTVLNHRKAPPTPYSKIKLKSTQFWINNPTEVFVDSQGNPSNAWRPIIEAYVTKTIDKIETLGYRTLDDEDFDYHMVNGHSVNGQQLSLPHNEEGRYLVLEMLTNRGPQPVFMRTPGAEAGWNTYTYMTPHIDQYTINMLQPITRYNPDGVAETIDASKGYSFAPTPDFYNNNEWTNASITIGFNQMEYRTEYGGGNLNYRFYKPSTPMARDTVPLYIWLHGMDGGRQSGIPEAWQNAGHVFNGFAGTLVNPLHQEKYRSFVMAPQAHNTGDVVQIIQELLDEFPEIDETRIYVSGHSMGGMATLNLIGEYPDLVAAAMPGPGSQFTGGGTPQQIANWTNTPLWQFAINGDNYGMDQGSVTIFNSLRATNLYSWNGSGYTNYTSNNRLSYFNVISPFDYTGNYGDQGTVGTGTELPPWGKGWSHSAYEPMASNLVTTDSQWQVESADAYVKNNDGSSTGLVYSKTPYGTDVAGDTNFDWVFKQRRTGYSIAARNIPAVSSPYISVAANRTFTAETSAAITTATFTLDHAVPAGYTLVVYDQANGGVASSVTATLNDARDELTLNGTDLTGPASKIYYVAINNGTEDSTRTPLTVSKPKTPALAFDADQSTSITKATTTATTITLELGTADYTGYTFAVYTVFDMSSFGGSKMYILQNGESGAMGPTNNITGSVSGTTLTLTGTAAISGASMMGGPQTYAITGTKPDCVASDYLEFTVGDPAE